MKVGTSLPRFVRDRRDRLPTLRVRTDLTYRRRPVNSHSMTRRWLHGKPGAIRGVIVALACVVALGGGCGSSQTGNKGDTGFDSKPADGGDGGHADGSVADHPADAPVGCVTTAAPKSKGASESCACDSECRTGFCADGVCCNNACTDTCKRCDLPSSLGVCSLVPAGVQPSDLSECPADKALTCGKDGTCDGAGACRKYVVGTECKPGTCSGDSITGAMTCDGNGSCSQSATTPCDPYSCDPNTNLCATACTANSQCAAGPTQACVAGSCGEKLNGAAALSGAECVTGFVANGVCCNVACAGPCVSCHLPGSVGICEPIDFGLPDPGNQCPATLASACGTTGLCDGAGSCAIFPANTPCAPATCSGGVLSENAQACDGRGTCQSANLVDCTPYLCSNGACNSSCKSDKDCAPTTACEPTTGKCTGKMANGQPCKDASLCNSNQCVDGYCCESSCLGACRSCGLPATLGQCVEVAAGLPDPRATCTDKGTTSCGTNGKCDGSGACQKYPVGYTCGQQSCVLGAYTPPPACNASGQCVAPDASPCNPYVCNGQVCYNSCTSDSSQCAPPSVCDTSKASCGPKGNGKQCGKGTECLSGICAQGVCCSSVCTGACMACNLPATLGYCTAVADGASDPQGLCVGTANSTCGTTGACKSGKCAYVAQGFNCKGSSCATNSSETPASKCDGLGTCATPSTVPCGTFICSSASAACETICATDADCVSPNTCVGNSCGKKPNGQTCANGPQCISGICTEGVCCDKACSDAATGGLCMSCKVSGKVGTCSPVPVGGADPKKLCAASNALGGDCSNAGTCNGAGACQPWSTAQGCRLASCAGTTLTAAANCDGKGSCPAPTTQSCDPYVCSTTSPSCKTTCTADTDCDKQTCLKVNNQCGTTLPNGQACKANTDCNSGFCTSEGVCCNVACTGACQSCTISGKKGTCSNIAASGTPRDTTTCPANPPCGDTGSCDGNGGCQLGKAGTTCGSASCAPPVSGTLNGGTVSQSLAMVPAGACDGKGGCTPGSPVSCQNFQCNAANATCKTGCTSTASDCNSIAPSAADSTGGNTCINNTCQLKPNGSACANGFTCASGNCVDGACCGSPSCGTCQACNIANAQGNLDGNCRTVGTGTTEPHNLCAVTGNTTCGTDGKCTAAGACEKWNGTACTPGAGCADGHDAVNTTAGSGKCNGAGSCTPGTPAPCGSGFMCASGACATACTSANQGTNCDTVDNFSCIGGICSKVGVGQICTLAAACGTGNCVDGVCCMSTSCPVCSSCNLGGSVGTCSNVPANTPDGTCVGSCPTPTSASGLCSGTGSCLGTTSCPAGYTCSGGICATSCTTDANCDGANGYGCFSGSCKKKPGKSCSANGDCGAGVCGQQGVCCDKTCGGSCQTCASGTCTSIAAGGTPRDPTFCPATSTCGNTGACNGSGACKLADVGSPCNVTISCANGSQSGGAGFCDGSGSCNGPGSTPCSPYVCGANACLGSCTANAQCAAGFACASNGTCEKANGQTCSASSDCASGACVSNGTFKICCNTGCTDATCGSTAFCKPDGSACKTHAAGETCGSGVDTCSPDNLSSIAAPTCGGGQCVTPNPVACNPGYLCSGAGVCATSCQTNASCNTSAGYSCINNLCAKEGNGQTCTTDANCTPGSFCISDGNGGKMCCAADCTDASCGTKAACAPGGLSCQTHLGDTCGQASCSSDNLSSIAAGTCDGAGNCTAASPVVCTPYLCAGGNCRTTCTMDANCDTAAGYSCINGHCAKEANGQPCSTNANCASGGHCISDGNGGKMCCAAVCTDVACGTKAACTSDGSGCQTHQGDTCGTATCSDSLHSVATGKCDGVGGCTLPDPVPCAPGDHCTGGSCGNSCNTSSDCPSGYTCSAHQCQPQSGLGGACQTNGDCSTGTCVGNICCATPCTDSPPCGTKGVCLSDGSACQSYAGTPCGTAGCSVDNLSTVAVGICSGGNCSQAATSCNGYLCSGGSCLLSCTDDTACDIAHGYLCDTSVGTCHQ